MKLLPRLCDSCSLRNRRFFRCSVGNSGTRNSSGLKLVLKLMSPLLNCQDYSPKTPILLWQHCNSGRNV